MQRCCPGPCGLHDAGHDHKGNPQGPWRAPRWPQSQCGTACSNATDNQGPPLHRRSSVNKHPLAARLHCCSQYNSASEHKQLATWHLRCTINYRSTHDNPSDKCVTDIPLTSVPNSSSCATISCAILCRDAAQVTHFRNLNEHRYSLCQIHDLLPLWVWECAQALCTLLGCAIAHVTDACALQTQNNMQAHAWCGSHA